MDRQAIFNKAYLGLASQGFERSMRPKHYKDCAYRGDGGRRCAIGWCIPDDKYDVEFEGKSAIDDNLILASFGAENATREELAFINGLQYCHDAGYGPIDMQDLLAKLAIRYNLIIPIVERN